MAGAGIKLMTAAGLRAQVNAAMIGAESRALWVIGAISHDDFVGWVGR